MTALLINAVTVSIGGQVVVGPISLELGGGERLGVVGESGSGKSLLLSAIAGLTPAGAVVSGSIRLDGRETVGLEDQSMARLRGENIGFVFQEPMTALNPLRRIGDQIGETVNAGREALVKEALGLAGLSPAFAERFPHQLSGGQRQRALIAMAIIQRPQILLADEPTTALDAVTQSQIISLLRNLANERRMATILVTHDLGLAASVCDRIAIMRQGKIVESLLVKDGFASLSHPYSLDLLAAARFRPAALSPPFKEHVLSLKASADHTERTPFGRVRRRIAALRDVSIDIAAGETVGLVGSSGCGKSTLARVILRLHPKGDAEIVETSPASGGPVQMVFQDPASSLDPRMRIADIVAEPLWGRRDLGKAERRRRAEALLARVGLPQDAGARRPHQLSGGQRQRVAIARALIAEPRLVILDEALSALDVTVQKQILILLGELQAERSLSYLLITHDMNVLKGFAHRVMVMENGAIVEAGETGAVLASPAHATTRALINAADTVRSAL